MQAPEQKFIRTRVKQYVNSSRILTALFFFPLWLKRKWIKGRTAGLMLNYDQVVNGGHLIIGPTNFPGHFKLDATSDLAKRVICDGVFEPELTGLLSRFADIGGDVVNVGANVGFYAIYFAHCFSNIRRVIAIEPNPEAFELLKYNIASNGVGDRVECVQACIGDVPGQVEFAFVPGKSEYSSIARINHAAVSGFVQEHVTVNVFQLSDVTTDRDLEPGLIFIDTEGAELLVIRGAEEIIKKSRPLLFFECEDKLLRKFGHTSEMLHSAVAGLGYEVRNALAPRLELVHPFSGVAVAIPNDRREMLRVLQGITAE
jgi:FkbM family methyltransferase